MLHELKRNGWKKSSEALNYWKLLKENQGIVIPQIFNKVVKAFLSSQASSASAERLFGDLAKLENNQAMLQLANNAGDD